MKISTATFSILTHFIVSVSSAFSNPHQKCCPVDHVIVRENATLLCRLDVDKRIQTNFLKNDFITEANLGTCIDVYDGNKTAIFDVDENGDVHKKHDISVHFYPKCCHLEHAYNPKIHACQPWNVSKNIVPPNSFIFVGLPSCEIIQDIFISNLGGLNQSVIDLRFKNDDRTFDEGKFCVDSTVSGSFVARLCENYDLCKSIRCVRKCCQDGQSFVNGSKCKDTFKYGVNLDVSKKIEEPEAPFAIIHGMPRPISILKESKNFYIDASGVFSTYSNITDSYNRYEPSEYSYCIEHAYKKGSVNGYTIFSRALKPQLQIKFVVTRWIKILSCVFLFLTMAVYLALPKMLNLFGKILLSYSLATFLFFFFLCLSQFLSTEFNDVVCKSIGFLTIMASFWSFTWLNIMCTDIWVSFGTPRTFSGPLQRNELKKLLQYSIYGWGVPFLLVIIIILLNVSSVLPESLHPYVGVKKCYMENTAAQPGNYAYNLFITLPVLLQQVANIILFVKTLIHCLKIKGEIQRMNESTKKNYSVGREELNLVMKLGVIMGVSFVFETVSSVYDFSRSSVTRNIEVVWDAINCLQGVFIFVVFICKKKVIDNLLERFNVRKICKYDVSSSLGTQDSVHSNSTKRTTVMSLR